MATGFAAERFERVPWYIWCAAAAVTCSMVGIHWDISWHRSIGRDTFWTPAHIVIHLCGLLAGISCGFLILSTTFSGGSQLRDSSVRLWGFRAPLGAFIAAWGGIAMITSAPFDNWWHDAYGLDVKIISPPHMLLAAGIVAVHMGALILILGNMNRADGELRQRFEILSSIPGVGEATVNALMVETPELGGAVTPARDLRSQWWLGSQEDEENRLQRLSLPARDHSAGRSGCIFDSL